MIGTLSSDVAADLAYDVAIVGGGPAGITLALELATSKRRVALFEGGSSSWTSESQARYAGEVTTSEGVNYPPLDVFRLRHLGGTSNHWSGWCRPLEDGVFTDRPWTNSEPWPISRRELDGGYARAHELCEIGVANYDATDLCRRTGLALPIRATDTVATPVWRISPPTRFGERFATELNQAAIDVFLRANCVDLELGGGRARALHLVADDGSRHRVEAERVVLACGGIDTARSLLLAAQDEPALNRSGTLATGFAEHLHGRVGAVLAVRREVEGDDSRLRVMTEFGDDGGTPFKVGIGLQEEVSRRNQIIDVSFTLASPQDRFAAGTLPHGSAVASLETERRSRRVVVLPLTVRAEQRFSARSRISLVGDRDDLGVPRVRLDWRVEPSDVADIQRALGIVALEIQRQGLGPVVDLRAGGRIEALRGGGHHMGGARMSDDPDRGVVDRDLRCHAVSNLFVCSSAVFPAAGFSNPTLTIVALAVRLAGLLGSEG